MLYFNVLDELSKNRHLYKTKVLFFIKHTTHPLSQLIHMHLEFTSEVLLVPNGNSMNGSEEHLSCQRT